MKLILLILLFPALLLGYEQDNDPDGGAYDQGIMLHPGWNLVSWNIEVIDSSNFGL